jgi:hypothetical protein
MALRNANMIKFTPGSTIQTKPKISPLPRQYAIYGVPGSGKTTMAATASKFFPTEALPTKEPVFLEDLCYLTSEHGLTSLSALNVFPGYLIDLVGMQQTDASNPDKPVAKDIIQAMNWAEQELTFARKAGAEIVVIDTATNLVNLLSNYYFAPGSNNTDGQRSWGEIGSLFGNLMITIQLLGFKSIWLCHAEENTDKLAGEQAGKQQATREANGIARGTAHDGNIRPALAGGKTKKLLTGSSDIEGWLELKKVGLKYERRFYPIGKGQAQGKSRYELHLDKEELPNIRHLEDKILKGASKK